MFLDKSLFITFMQVLVITLEVIELGVIIKVTSVAVAIEEVSSALGVVVRIPDAGNRVPSVGEIYFRTINKR